MASEARAAAGGKARASSSRYDFVKVRLWLQGERYHVFSRYLVARALQEALVPEAASIKISLRLKKTLVDEDLEDVSQREFEARLWR